MYPCRSPVTADALTALSKHPKLRHQSEVAAPIRSCGTNPQLHDDSDEDDKNGNDDMDDTDDKDASDKSNEDDTDDNDGNDENDDSNRDDEWGQRSSV